MPGPNTPYTQLDFQQVIKQVFEESSDRLRVDAVATIITPPEIAVMIDAADDSIKIGNGTGNFLAVNPDGSINVSSSDVPPNLKYLYNSISSVASGIETTLLTYTPLIHNKILKVDASGDNIAEYRVKINGSFVNIHRTYFGGGLNTVLDFNSGINLSAGQTLLVTVIHNRPSLGNFNANVLYNEV